MACSVVSCKLVAGIRFLCDFIGLFVFSDFLFGPEVGCGVWGGDLVGSLC